MEKYKIIDLKNESIISVTDELYIDLYNDTVVDKRFNLYKCIDLDMKKHELLCISDIHSDAHRFWQFLYLNKLVLEDKKPDVKDIKWNPAMTNKILVICGDIIDGQRPPNENFHSSENNDILIHTIIYNLRLDALQYNSYVFCTLGNHDFCAIHNGSRIREHAYINYIDSKSKKNYIDRFINIFSNLYRDPEHSIQNVSSNDAIYFGRAFILSHFYLIGFPFFLKINETLFAHAGFHKTENVISLFENGQNSNRQIQPLLIHRKILEQMSKIHFLTGYINLDTETDTEAEIEFIRDPHTGRLVLNKIIPTYAKYYDKIFERCIGELHETAFDKALIDKYANYFIENDQNSLVDNFLFTRRLQKNCREVDEILQTYGCKMLVVGHCPTCLGKLVFSDENVGGITDCDDARIVFSCSSKLLTVDIAFSSGFTPMKYFLECLSITMSPTEQLFMKVIRHYLIRDETIEYNHRMYDNDSKSWL